MNDARLRLSRSGAGRGELSRRGARRGSARDRKSIPCKFFYDARGSALFEQICAAARVLSDPHRDRDPRRDTPAEIAAQMGPHCRLIELGSGASRKVRILLDALDRPAAYVPVDISREHLREAATSLAADFPVLPVIAVCADYTRPFPMPPLPGPARQAGRLFPGLDDRQFRAGRGRAFSGQSGRNPRARRRDC